MKRGTRSHRDSRTYLRDKSEWVKVENTHPAIVDTETWDKVQRINETAKTATKYKDHLKSLFSGLLICPDCNTRMGYIKRKSCDSAYICRTYTESGCVVCSSHRITERALKTLVLTYICEAAKKIAVNKTAILEALQHTLQSERKKNTTAKEKRLIEQKIYSLDIRIAKLLEEKAEGLTIPDDFYNNIKEIESKREEQEKKLSTITASKREAETKLSNTGKLIALIKEKSAINDVDQDIDRDLLESLIHQIKIGKRQTESGTMTQDIQIYWKHALPNRGFTQYGTVAATETLI